jgi:hypothetical protein
MKHYSLLGWFVSYEENKVLWIRTLATVIMIVKYDFNALTIVNYDHKTFMVLVTEWWRLVVANLPAYCNYSGKKLLCNTGLRISEKNEILKKKFFLCLNFQFRDGKTPNPRLSHFQFIKYSNPGNCPIKLHLNVTPVHLVRSQCVVTCR